MPGVSRTQASVQWVSRNKVTVQWTVTPANGKSMDGFLQSFKRSRMAQRRVLWSYVEPTTELDVG